MLTYQGRKLRGAAAPRLWAICALLCSGLLFNPANAAEQENTMDDPLLATAVEAYLWGFPLVYNMGTFNHFLAGQSRIVSDVKFNRFSHARKLQDPKDAFVSPNIDVLFSLAFCDLADGPLVVGVPDTQGRYYVLQFLDPWTNSFAYIGRRATGTKAGEYLVASADYSGPVPDGMTLIRAPSDVFAIVGRVAIDDEHDLAAVHAVQDGFSLRPLNSATAKADKLSPIPQPAAGVRADLMSWERLRVLLAAFPPPPAETAWLEQLAPLGLLSKTSPYVNPDPQLAQTLLAAEKAAQAQLAVDMKKQGKIDNGWNSIIHLFDYNNNYFQLGTLDSPQWRIADFKQAYHTRAAAARLGLWGNNGYEAAFFQVFVDGQGEQLNGAHKYEWTLPEAPPAAAFWSLTMYDMPKFYLVANPLNRYSISSTSKGLKYNADGSLTMYLQAENPGPDKESNWLPTPKGDFRPALSIYDPQPKALDPSYTLPAIRRVE